MKLKLFTSGVLGDDKRSIETTQDLWFFRIVHDFFATFEGVEVYNKIFASHFGQLSVIFLWTAGNLFCVSSQGNFEAWVADPLHTRPIAHRIFDVHFGQPAIEAYTREGASGPVTLSTSGLYQWWYTIGMRTNEDLSTASLFLFIVAILFLIAGFLHGYVPFFKPNMSFYNDTASRLNHHLAALFGVSSIAWAGHIIHIAIPESRGQHMEWDNLTFIQPHPSGLAPLFNGKWWEYALNPDPMNHTFGVWDEASAILTFRGGLDPQTGSLWLTDIAHHHLAIGVIFIFAGHLYKTNWNVGLELPKVIDSQIIGGRFSHRGLYATVAGCLNLQLSLALAGVGTVCSLVAQHMYSLPAYAYIANDYVTQAALYTHHQYIAGFIMCGAFAHGAIFLVTEYDPEINRGNVLAKFLENREVIVSHLSWVCLFLGFHTLGLYIHNDVMLAFDTPERQILIEPIFAEYIQSAQGKSLYEFDVLLSSPLSEAYLAPGRVLFKDGLWLPEWLDAINNSKNSVFVDIGPGDFLVHHAIALGLHTTTLVLLKGALDARGSKLMPDKKRFGYGFPCDGPGRGGTCDISAWDAFYLAIFWMLNTIGWVTFYWHWKHLGIWQGNTQQFYESSTYLMGWLRDYLWLNSSQLINGYNPTGMNALSVWSWMFLFGHLIYATGFMFLISWRGYWQELIETLVWAHDRLPIVLWSEKPVALTIVQARFVGLVHFTVGYILTYAAFLIAATSGKFG